MNARRLFGALLGAVFAASLAFAQGPAHAPGQHRPGGRGMGQMRMLDQLHLTAAQKKRIAALQKAQMGQMRAYFQKNKGKDRTAMRAHFEASRKAYDAKLRKILTVAQYKKYQAMRAKMRANRKAGGFPGTRGKGRPAR